jgi:simple sugar transport system ATP-binding protein
MRQIAKDAISKYRFPCRPYAVVGDLSVAEKQMIAISRALMFNTRLIIMDNQLLTLTKKEVRNLQYDSQAQGAGIAILFVSHKLK